MADFSYDIFLSHNSKDKPRVRQLAERLRQAGLRVWFDEWNIKSGDIISLKVDEGLERSRVLLLCISPNALASGWVSLERSTAIHRDPSNAERRFIPLLLANCDLPETLRRYKHVDFRDETEEAFAEILTACRSEMAKALVTAKLTPQKRPKKAKLHDSKTSRKTESLAVLERTVRPNEQWIRSIALSPDGKWVATGSGSTSEVDCTVRVWNLETGEQWAKLEGHTSWVWGVAFAGDGKRIVSGTESETRIWDIATEKLLRKIAGGGSSVVCFDSVEAEPAAPFFLRSRGSDVELRRLESGKLAKRFSGHAGHVQCLATSPDGRRFASGSQDETVRIWSIETNESLTSLSGHSGWVLSSHFSSDGRHLVTGSTDRTIKVWDLRNETCAGTLEGHGGDARACFSPDGTLVASSGGGDRTVRIWNWRTGMCLQTLRIGEHLGEIAFSRDGLRIVVGDWNGNVYVYRVASPHGSRRGEATHRYVNAKVVLLGEGTVGKTSLAHRLVEDKYVVRDRTHGMNVWRLDLPLAPDAAFEREALLWDLAGQEDYRLIHKLFLDETALALLLVNPQKDDPFAEAGDWLKALHTGASEPESKREPAKLLIFSQTDVGGMKLGKAKIERFRQQYGFADWLPTSAKTGENCSDQENGHEPSKLKRLIAASIPWDKLPWTSTPRLLAELKDAMMAMRDKTDIRLVRFAELSQRMEQALPSEKFGESEVRTAVTLLANNGLARPLKFGDLVLLQPELLNGYAGAIIRAARAHIDEIGCVLEADIYDPKFDFTGVERLKNRPDEELLLRALVQTFLDHSLCIAEDTPQGRQLVFPSQYRREKDIPRDPDIFVSYTFSGEWQTVWTTLVVRLWYSQEFKHRELWRNAAEFASPKGYILGLKIDNQQGEGVAKISLYFDKEVPDELKSIFIEYVHRHLAKFGCEVSRDRRYLCPECGKPIKDLEAVRKRLDAEKDFIYCQGCDAKVPLIDFIEQRLKSDPVARKILAMDATATRELDTQALEQILIGHMMAIAGEANQIFRIVHMSELGIDGEVEFKDDDGKASGKRVYVQLKSENYYIRKWSHRRNADGIEVLDVRDDSHLEDWVSQPVDVYLVLRQRDETTGGQTIRWMNVTRYLKTRRDKTSRQIPFMGKKLDMDAIWRVRDEFFQKAPTRKRD